MLLEVFIVNLLYPSKGVFHFNNSFEIGFASVKVNLILSFDSNTTFKVFPSLNNSASLPFSEISIFAFVKPNQYKLEAFLVLIKSFISSAPVFLYKEIRLLTYEALLL
ncbi:hypothetical protein ACSXAY_19250 (plasmid) [Clostridium perfringens]